MQVEVWGETLLLFLFCAGELALFTWFVSGYAQRRLREPLFFVIFFAGAALLTLWLEGRTSDLFLYYYTLVRYSILALYFLASFRLRGRLLLYSLACIDLVQRPVFNLFHNVMVANWNVEYLLRGTEWGRRLAVQSLYFFCVWIIFFVLRRLSGGTDKELLRRGQIGIVLITCIPGVFISHELTILIRQDVMWAKGSLPVLMIVISCLCGLIIVIGQDNVVALVQREKEVQKIRDLMEGQYRQYLFKKETIDQVNRKYHDMKNHLLCLERLSDSGEGRVYIEKLREDIKPYELLTQTGNMMLDVLLFEKLRICQEEGIALLLQLEPELFVGVEDMDLVTIFGNALDNAVEATRLCGEAQRREVFVSGGRREDWIILRFENTTRPGAERNGIRTTKENPQEHGFGLKSIRYTVEQYQGSVAVEQLEGRFVLKILFLPSKTF